MTAPIRPLVSVQRRRVQHQLVALIVEAQSLGIDVDRFMNMTLAAWSKAREGQVA